jgi:hypothetical protein
MSLQAREHILRIVCRDLKLDGEFDFAHLASMTPGCVFFFSKNPKPKKCIKNFGSQIRWGGHQCACERSSTGRRYARGAFAAGLGTRCSCSQCLGRRQRCNASRCRSSAGSQASRTRHPVHQGR